jgi:4,5-DOPA dioxygenase extradiol
MVESESTNVSAAMPVIFAAHGAPMLLEDARWMEELAVWARSMPKPKAVLVISAHWESRPTTLGATETVPLVYDFYGFPAHFYQTQYPAPGAPALAARVRQLLSANGLAFRDDAKRGLDHGAYVPLVAMYPAADVPVLQVSLPALDTGELFRLGNTLAPLRAEGVLIFGSGFLTHNMSYAFRPGTPAWATEFDQWVAESLTKGDVDALLDFQERAPAARVALPTWEHYAPLLVSVGAALPPNAGVPSGQVQFPITGWWMDGAFTRRSVQFS